MWCTLPHDQCAVCSVRAPEIVRFLALQGLRDVKKHCSTLELTDVQGLCLQVPGTSLGDQAKHGSKLRTFHVSYAAPP